MKILILMAGRGKRFNNFLSPKPLIELDGKPMIEHVVDYFPRNSEFIFVCNETHLKTTNIKNILKRIAPNCRIIGIADEMLKGPAYSSFAAFEFIGDNEEYKQMYDYCCNILMKHNNDFCGKFTDNILEETHDIMTAHRKDILEIITTNAVFGSDKILDYLDFYQNIFEPIIDQLYKSYKDKKIEMATSLVDKYMKKIEDYSLNDVNCCICLDRINRDEDEDEDNDENNKEKDKYVDLPCKHIGVV